MVFFAAQVSFELRARHGVRSTLVEPREARPTKWMHRKRREARDPTLGTFQHLRTEFPEAGGDAGLQRYFRGASCIVGMHPDEATEPIIDFAVAAGVPFAVVPCCVFCSRPGTVSYEQFLDFLKAKVDSRGRGSDAGAGRAGRGACAAPAASAAPAAAVAPAPAAAADDKGRSKAKQDAGERGGGVEETFLNFGGRNRVLFWRGPRG